jgi:general secretion pathway protein C
MFDAYFKQYFWTFHLVVIFLGAFLVARTVNAFVERAVEVPPEAIVQQAPPAAPSEGSGNDQVDFSAFLEANLLDAMREDLVAEQAAKEAQQEEAQAEATEAAFDDAQCTSTSMGAKLLATVVSDDPETSVAVFEDTSKSEAVAFRKGDRLLDQATVHEISWRHVKINRDGRCELLSLDADAPARKRPAVVKQEPKKDKDDLGSDIERVNDDEFNISRGEIDGVLSNLNKLATQARIVPSFHNGKANGFKLFSIRPNSLYAKIGIQNGDIVQRINGFELNSPDKALEIYGKLKDAQTITVDLLRRGKSTTMTYNIR